MKIIKMDLAYNIISYNLNNRWVSENNFKLGYSYENIIVEDNFSGIVNKKEEALIIRPKVFLNVTNSVDVELNNLLYFPNKDIVAGFKNDFQKDILTYIPLVRGLEDITVTIRTK